MGPLKGRPAWNEVSAPIRSANHVIEPNNERSRPTAKYIPSVETPQRPEQAGGMKSEQNNHSIRAGNVKKSSLQSPPAEPMPKGLMDGGKY